MAACKSLKVVGRHASVSTPSTSRATGWHRGRARTRSNSQAVAEHALMFMLVCVKKTLYQTSDPGRRLGRQGGLAGTAPPSWPADARRRRIGNIGRRIAKFCGALGMNVLAYDKYVPADEIAGGAEPSTASTRLIPGGLLTCQRRYARDQAHDQRHGRWAP